MRLPPLLTRLTRRPDPGLSDTPWLVVGLGNPGPQYAGTRHNIGAMAVEALAGSLGGGLSAHRRCRAEVFEGRLGPLGHGATRIVLARSRGFMNESGGPVSCLMEFYKVPLEQLVSCTTSSTCPWADCGSSKVVVTTATTACAPCGGHWTAASSCGSGLGSGARRVARIRRTSS